MEIFDHTAYEIAGKEMDVIYKRCNECDGENTFPHTCRFYVGLGAVSNEEWKEYHGKAWCMRKGE